MSPRARSGSLHGVPSALAALSIVVAACGAPHVDKPAAPDMSELIASYDDPRAMFEPGASPDIAAALIVVDELLQRTNLREQLVGVLEQVLDQGSNLSNREDGLARRIKADGYMLVTRTCAGWTSPATPDRLQNGALLVTATFSQRGLDPTVWGSAATCRYLSGEARIELDQSAFADYAVSIYWGESAPRENLEERALLVDLNLAASIEDEPLLLDFDFRSLSNGNVEYRIPRPDGSLIAEVAGERVGLRAANGTFDCDRALRCRDAGVPGGN